MNQHFIQDKITRDMSEGVILISMSGVIEAVNPAAETILEMKAAELEGRPFAASFFEYEENDAFTQTVLDAIYDSASVHHNIVGYYTGSSMKQLNVTTSFMRDGDEKLGIIAVLSDISELVELRDAVQAMERIKKLNEQLEMRNELISATFGRFLSDEIVKQLLDTPDGLKLGGRKTELSILMSDLRGFTALSERMEAEDLLFMLNHYLGEMTEVIQHYSGTIIEFIGDGILAIFGAPAENPDHADDCVSAAVAMEARMPEINEWNKKHGYPELEMGIGVESGPVIVGNIGSERRTKYGVTGNHVNLCGRIESYTVGGQILVSEHTVEKIKLPLTVESEQVVYPKGAENGMRLFNVTGIGELHCGIDHEEPEKLSTPAPVSFFMIEDKQVSSDMQTGKLLAVSQTDAVLETDFTVKEFENLQINIENEEKLFAKVLKTTDNTSLLRFTSKPENFRDWIEHIRQ